MVTIVETRVPKGKGNNQYGGQKDNAYKIKEWGYIFPTKSDAELYAKTHYEKDGVIYAKPDNLYEVKVNSKKKLYLKEADAQEYASKGYKIQRVKKVPEGYQL